MDYTPYIHALLSGLFQIVWGLVTGDWISGGVIGVAFWCGREHSQAEDRYIKANGGKRSVLPWNIGFKKDAWNLPSALDVLVPAVFAVIIFVVVKMLESNKVIIANILGS